ncbi:efflux RND transporter periplasmic adaptor subunit [Solimonas marina]|uniref:Efflux RND transporter periplasmic adaptor subunit n=1 Tax=Solimonas marina TaxID=2714601 RepID=A0A970B618_9GAMM|nr:efflux RND transporter periplasmic adaptor subunit [Solimonas marina]NKF22328.1 efflux RND transporter periplasmic adaptor subunit [Solimonas marina]
MTFTRTLPLVLAVALAACRHEAPPPAASARPVHVAAVRQGPAEAPIVASGVLATRDEAQLAFKTGGIVRSIAVRPGDRVDAGQVLAEIDTTEVDAAVTQAQASHDKAARDLTRGRTLFADDVITREQLDDLGTAEAVARAQLDAARFNQAHAQIVAPGPGTVLQRLVEPRTTVAAGQPILVLSQSHSGHVLKLGLADRDVVRVQEGDTARIRFDAYPQRSFAAHVQQIGHGADPRNGTFAVELALDGADGLDNPPSGLVGTATIAVRGDGNTRSYVPLGALVEGDQHAMMLFTTDGRTAQEHSVGVAFVSGDDAALIDALPDGTRVVTDGAAYLDDGDAVRLVP